MCGRAYSTYTEEELEARYSSIQRKRTPLGELKPNYNLAPTQMTPVVLNKDGEIQLDLFRWGLIPPWASSVKDASKYSLINAKGEEITEKRSYKHAFKKRRCIVPVSGFFEWEKEKDSPKRPFAIYLKNEPIISLAGIWETWKSPQTKEEIHSCSIITTSANSFMETIHNRMPVILSRSNEPSWLDPNNRDTKALQELLKPCPSEWLEAYEVSTWVNSPRNNTQETLKPLGDKLS